MALTLLMARHGQTDFNVDDRWQGRIDPPLNSTGMAQADALAAALPAGIQVLVASPMLRVRQTAEPVARRFGLTPQLVNDFRERDFGVFEGLSGEEALQRYPELARRNVAYRWDEAPPEAESVQAVVDRVGRGLERLRAEHDGKTVLLVSHGFVVRCLRYLLEGVSRDDFFAAERLGNGRFLSCRLD
jgi:broad specificity phosphatase PhoE